MNIGTIVAEGTMKAATEILCARGLSTKDIDVDRLVLALRREAKIAVKAVVADAKDALDTVGAAWAHELINAECVDAARRATSEVIVARHVGHTVSYA